MYSETNLRTTFLNLWLFISKSFGNSSPAKTWFEIISLTNAFPEPFELIMHSFA
jgi:hypothetical protein